MARTAAVGVDIGGTRTKVALVAPGGSLLDRVILPTRADAEPAGPFLDRLAGTIAGLGATSARGLGIAVPGVLDDDRRRVLFNPNTPALVGIDIREWAEGFGLPVSVEQDLNAPAIAEHRYGAGRGSRRFLAAAIGTGLGAGIVIDGEVLRFAGQAAGDNGHVILDPSGPACTAGCHGCAEAYAAIPAIECAALSAANYRWGADLAGRDELAAAVIADARDGRPAAVEIVAGIGRRLGHWLACLAPIFLPDRIALCGGVAEAGDALVTACREAFDALVGRDYARCALVLGSLGGFAGAIGAASPFLEES